MAQKPKARSAKKKAIPKKKSLDEKQLERFVETARTLEVDETSKEFEATIKKILLTKLQR